MVRTPLARADKEVEGLGCRKNRDRVNRLQKGLGPLEGMMGMGTECSISTIVLLMFSTLFWL